MEISQTIHDVLWFMKDNMAFTVYIGCVALVVVIALAELAMPTKKPAEDKKA